MTVCVAIKVHDCIVFAADSALSTSSTTPHGMSLVDNVWRHGLKVFNVHRNLPIVAMFAGMANFGPMSITNLAKDFRSKLMDASSDFNATSYTLEEVSNQAFTFFKSEYRKIFKEPLEGLSFSLWIGGYSHNNLHGEIWKITMVNGQWEKPLQVVMPSTSNMIVWGGQTQAIDRLIRGFDPQLVSILQEQLHSSQIKTMESSITDLATPLVHPSMPIQDAINLADFLVDMTKRYVAFLPGADTVSGDTDIATVTKHEGFKWIQRKHYYPQHLNSKEKGHVT